MKKKLIVVADDFGFSEAYNYGAIKAYKEGIVTVLSLMSNMEAAPHAVKLWRKTPVWYNIRILYRDIRYPGRRIFPAW